MLPDKSARLANGLGRHRLGRHQGAATKATSEAIVLDAIRAYGTQNFTGADIAREAGLCRQTVYKLISKLNGQGHRIEGAPRLGFMARLNEEAR